VAAQWEVRRKFKFISRNGTNHLRWLILIIFPLKGMMPTTDLIPILSVQFPKQRCWLNRAMKLSFMPEHTGNGSIRQKAVIMKPEELFLSSIKALIPASFLLCLYSQYFNV
jgi:hypothetical protein